MSLRNNSFSNFFSFGILKEYNWNRNTGTFEIIFSQEQAVISDIPIVLPPPGIQCSVQHQVGMESSLWILLHPNGIDGDIIAIGQVNFTKEEIKLYKTEGLPIGPLNL